MPRIRSVTKVHFILSEEASANRQRFMLGPVNIAVQKEMMSQSTTNRNDIFHVVPFVEDTAKLLVRDHAPIPVGAAGE